MRRPHERLMELCSLNRGPVYSPCFRLLLEMAVPWCPDLDFRLGPMPGDATSSDQVLAVRGKQGG
jgi:hypothetical protein